MSADPPNPNGPTDGAPTDDHHGTHSGTAPEADRDGKATTDSRADTPADAGTPPQADGAGTTTPRSESPSATATAPDTTAGADPTEPLLESRPTLVPTVCRLVVVALLGGAIAGYLATNPTVLGDESTTGVVLRLVLLVTAIGIVRYLVRLIILRRTAYRVFPDRVKREYELLFRTRRREVPLQRIRRQELEQDRIQHLFGYGTIVVNQGLGVLRLDDVPNPDRVYDTITRQIQER